MRICIENDDITELRHLGPGQQRLGPREQLNGVSQWLDGSNVYGSDPCHAAKLRRPAPSSHLLIMSDNKPRKELLPMTGKAPDLIK